MLAVLLGPLTLMASAGADPAWVLWAEQRRSTPGSQYQRASVERVSSYSTLQECAAKLDGLQSAGDQRWGPAMLYRVVGDPKVEVLFITWQCLPATVEPRGPSNR